jgi:Flp pilus assembly protein CpaB
VMKRNIVPLLGIAFVVAIISTGIFYGLFAGRLRSSIGELPAQSIVVAARTLDPGTVLQTGDLRVSEVKGAWKSGFSKPEELIGGTIVRAVQQNEPILQDQVASRDAKSGTGAGGVPSGMRAISIHVAESSGVIGLLHPGTKVDVQAFLHRETSHELRTILQDVEVLEVSAQPEPAGGNPPPLPVVTVLARPEDIDLIALADSGARIRLALRNPLDDGAAPRHAMELASVFASSGSGDLRTGRADPKTARQQSSKILPADSAALWDHPIRLYVRALAVSVAGLAELDSKLAGASASLTVAALPADTDSGQLIRGLEQKQELEVVSSWRLMAGVGRPISFRAGTGSECRLRVRFSPEVDSSGKLSLRVQPEITLQRGDGMETRQFAAGVGGDGAFLVSGLLKDQGDRQLLERLYPGHSWNGRQLVILVSSRDATRSAGGAVAATNRRQ